MADISGTFRATFDLRAPLEQAIATFADPAAHAACFQDLERHERVDDRTLRIVLRRQSYGVTSFQGDYTCRYERDGETVRWTTLRGNVHAHGSARFSRRGEGCRLEYEQHVTVELQVGALLGKTIQPIAARALQDEARRFVERLVQRVEAG